MKSIKLGRAALAAVALMTTVSTLQVNAATTLFEYGFEDMTTYPFTTTGTGVDRLTGQVCSDGAVWKTYLQRYPTQTTYNRGFEVGYKTGDTVDSTVVIKQGLNFAGSTGIVGNTRDIGPYSFTAADTAIEQYVQLYVSGSGTNLGTIWGGLDFDTSATPGTLYGPNLGKIGIWKNTNSVVLGGGLNTSIRPLWLSNDYGSQPPAASDPTRRYYVSQTLLTIGDWYEFKGVMDFSVLGGQVAWSARDLTLGATEFTPIVFGKYNVQAATWVYMEDVSTMPLGLTPVGGAYTANGFGFVAQRGSSYELYADNFKLVDPGGTPVYLPGDADRNGTVDGADLNTVLSNYNQSFTVDPWSMGDFDGNGTVDGADLNTVLSNYNQHLAAAGAPGAPEPSTLLLAAAGLVGLLAYAWRKRK
jgi:hypothetical protein